MKFYIVTIITCHSIKSWVKTHEKFHLFKSNENAEKYIANRIFNKLNNENAEKHISNRLFDKVVDDLNQDEINDMLNELSNYFINGKLNETYKDNFLLMESIRDKYDSLDIPCYLVYGYIDEVDTDDIQ